MDDVNHEEIRDQKDLCGGCGAPLRKTGAIEAEGHRGDAFECTRETCGYVEWRMYGEGYYDLGRSNRG